VLPFILSKKIAQKAQTMMRSTSGESFFSYCEAFSSLRHCEEQSDEAISIISKDKKIMILKEDTNE